MKIYNLKSVHEKKIHLLNREIREINLENKKKLGLAKKSIDSLNNKLWEQGKKKMNDYETDKTLVFLLLLIVHGSAAYILISHSHN